MVLIILTLIWTITPPIQAETQSKKKQSSSKIQAKSSKKTRQKKSKNHVKSNKQSNKKISSQLKTLPDQKKQPKNAFSIAEQAYIYGYPLVLMGITKDILTNYSSAGEDGAPLNQFMHKTRFPGADFTEVVRPNADTLYSVAFLNLAKEPLILEIPNMDGRYYLMPILDAWTNVFESIGKRTTGTKAIQFVITGPKWKGGELPSELKEIKSPTNMAWIIGRTEAMRRQDFRTVNALQKQFKLIPLSAYKKPYHPPSNVPTNPQIDMTTPPIIQIEKMDVETFFSKLNELMENNPPTPKDERVIQKFSKIGVAPGKKFEPQSFTPETLEKIKKGADIALRKIKESPAGDKIINSWRIMTSGVGEYGTDYIQRARIAYRGLGANLPEDAIYPTTEVDNTGRVLHGKNRYVIHFTKEQLPPVKGFWSLSLYDERQLFAANPIKRYNLGNRNPLKFNSDGSLDIYIQRESPGQAKESNWLPTPPGKFSLTMRLYWPESIILDGRWAPPPVRKVKD